MQTSIGFCMFCQKISVPADKVLGSTAPTRWMQMWKRERHLDHDILPIYSDLKFRIQHNGLRLHHKHRYRTLDINCVYHCPAVQTLIQWSTVVHWISLDLGTEACQKFGIYNILRVFNVAQWVVLKILWMERSNTIFRTDSVTSSHDDNNIGITVTRQATYQIKAHVQCLGHIDALNTRLSRLCADYIDTEQSASQNIPLHGHHQPPPQTPQSYLCLAPFMYAAFSTSIICPHAS